jgi:hypothetical protein
MKRSNLWILVASLIFPMVASAQEGGVKVSSGQQTQKDLPMHDRVIKDESTLKELEKTGGNPGVYTVYEETSMYLEPGWENGYVVLKDKTMMDGILLRYDLYHQQMQYIRDNDTMAFSRPEELDYLYIGDQKFIYTEFESEGVVKNGFFEVLHEGKCPLYLQRMVKYHLDPESEPQLKHDVYVRECGYFVKKSGEMARPIKNNKKSILCAFKDKEEEVSKFMDDNDLSGKTCDELKLVIAFYNSLP